MIKVDKLIEELSNPEYKDAFVKVAIPIGNTTVIADIASLTAAAEKADARTPNAIIIEVGVAI